MKSKLKGVEVMGNKLLIQASHSFRDAQVTIQVNNVSPFDEVILIAKMRDNFGVDWKSHAKFKADSNGEINTATEKPLDGTYSEPDRMGLFWSMSPVSNDIPKERTPLEPLKTTFTLKQNGKVIDEACLVRHLIDPEIERLPIREDGLVGTMFLQKEASNYPTVVVLGGSEGGLLKEMQHCLHHMDLILFH